MSQATTADGPRLLTIQGTEAFDSDKRPFARLELVDQISGRLPKGSGALDRRGAEGQGPDRDGWTQGGVLCRPPRAKGQDPDQERAADAGQGPDPIAAC